MSAITSADELHLLTARLDGRPPDGTVSDTTLGPPIPRPAACFAVGLNYADHAAEANVELPAQPLVFTKFPSCLTGPTADIELATEHADYEAELVVVIGDHARHVSTDDAWSHVAGLTVGNDISDRKLQFAASPPHFDLGKSRDGYGPIGPTVVSLDAVDDPDDLEIVCSINGEQRQADRTSNMVFDVPALIAYLSSILTLRPGDLIFTGTPDGIGATQGRFLRPGDTITTTIEGIGTLTNRCR